MTINGINEFGSLITKTGNVLNFEDFDLNKDGKISRGEYNLVLKKNDLDVIDLSNVDTNGNESLSEEEFAEMEQKIEMQNAVNGMLGQISVDFSGDNSKYIQDVLSKLKDFMKDFAVNYGRGQDVKQMAAKFKEQLPVKYNEIANDLIAMNVDVNALIFGTDDYAYFREPWNYVKDRDNSDEILQLYNSPMIKDSAKSLFAKKLKQNGIPLEKFEELFEKAYSASLNSLTLAAKSNELHTSTYHNAFIKSFNDYIIMTIDSKKSGTKDNTQYNADFYPQNIQMSRVGYSMTGATFSGMVGGMTQREFQESHNPSSFSDPNIVQEVKDIAKADFFCMIKEVNNSKVSLYKIETVFSELFDKAFEDTLRPVLDSINKPLNNSMNLRNFLTSLKFNILEAMNEWNASNAPGAAQLGQESAAQETALEAESSPVFTNEQISEIRSRVIENMYNKLINSVESLSAEQKKAYGKEIEALVDGFIAVYHGQHLELDLTAYIEEVMNTSDAQMLNNKAEEFLDTVESTGNYIDSNEFSKLKEKAIAFLKDVLLKGLSVQLGDVKVDSETKIEEAIAQYEDSELLIADMKKAIASLSTESKINKIKNAKTKDKAEESSETENSEVNNKSKKDIVKNQKDFESLKKESIDILKDLFSNGKNLKLGDVKIQYESDIYRAVEQYKDRESLLVDILKVLDEVSNDNTDKTNG